MIEINIKFINFDIIKVIIFDFSFIILVWDIDIRVIFIFFYWFEV